MIVTNFTICVTFWKHSNYILLSIPQNNIDLHNHPGLPSEGMTGFKWHETMINNLNRVPMLLTLEGELVIHQKFMNMTILMGIEHGSISIAFE